MKDKHIKNFNELNDEHYIYESDSEYESKWLMIPNKCEYKGNIYRILDIDLQGGYFTLHDVNAKKGDVWVFPNIDMDECNPVEE